MPSSPVNLQHGKFYHFYNRGINSCNLFSGSDNYEYFMHLYDKHISDIADSFAILTHNQNADYSEIDKRLGLISSEIKADFIGRINSNYEVKNFIIGPT